jgi:hypothetical protein
VTVPVTVPVTVTGVGFGQVNEVRLGRP